MLRRGTAPYFSTAWGKTSPCFYPKTGFSTACSPREQAVFPFLCGELWNIPHRFLSLYLKFLHLSPVFHPVFHIFNRVFNHSTVDNSVESVENSV